MSFLNFQSILFELVVFSQTNQGCSPLGLTELEWETFDNDLWKRLREVAGRVCMLLVGERVAAREKKLRGYKRKLEERKCGCKRGS